MTIEVNQRLLFYGSLLDAILNNNEKQIKELLKKLSEDELQDLFTACQILARLSREEWNER